MGESSKVRDEVVIQGLSAGAGAAFSTVCFFPLELIKTRLQAQMKKHQSGGRTYEGTMDVVQHLIEEDGMLGLFKGISPVLFRSVLSDSLYFFISSSVTARITKVLKRELNALEAVACGVVSACITQLVAHPIDTVTTKVLVCQEGKSVLEHCEAIYEKHGFTGFWNGYRASMILSLNPALQFTTFDRAKAFLLRKTGQTDLTAGQLFALGMVTKAFTLTIIYPLIRAKVSMQGSKKQIGMYQSFMDILNHEGVGGLYKGLKEQIGKSTLSTALLLTTKEEIATTVRYLYLKKQVE